MSFQKHIFKGKILEYENLIVNAYLEYFGTSQFHPKSSKIICYFLIHRKLTQKQLQELTGYSVGTISSYLSLLENKGFLKKRMIPGTHTMQYFIPGSLIQYINILRENTLKENAKAKDFFKSIKMKLNELLMQNLKGFDLIHSSVNEILNFLEIRERFYHLYNIEFLQENKNIKKKIQSYKIQEKNQYSVPIDNKILQIESKIINFFQDSGIFSEFKIEKTSVIKILGYFITRRVLNNKLLQKLTGLSAGSISQGLNLLLSMKLIEKEKENKSSRQLYKMKSVVLTLLNLLIETRKKRLQWEPIAIQILKELDDHMIELCDLNGYYEIYTLLLHVLRLFPMYKKQIEFIETYKNEIDK